MIRIAHAISSKFFNLDGLAIRNANWVGLRESIRENRFAENPLFHNVRAICSNLLKLAIRNFLVPRSAIRKHGFISGTPA